MSGPGVPIERLLEHREWVRGLARSLVFGSADADDLVQDAWVAALRSPPRHGESLRGWLATTIRNLARNRRRDAFRRDRREDAAPPRGDVPSAADLVEQADRTARVARAVVALEEPYRTTVLLRYFEDLPPRRIAAAMDVPVATVKTRLARAHERLRARLDDDEEGDRRAWCLALLPLARRASPAAPVAIGAAIMATTGTKVAAAAAVIAIAAVALWWNADTSAPDAARPGTVEETASAARPREQGAPRETPAAAAPATSVPHGRGLDVTVTDGAGRPIAGASVALHLAPPPLPDGFYDPGPRTAALGAATTTVNSDASGHAAVREPAGGRRMLVVEAAGYARSVQSVLVRDDEVSYPWSVVLDRACSLEGRVRAADGTPLAGATAFATPWGSDAALQGVERAETRAGDDGRFRIEGLAPGRWFVTIRTATRVDWHVGSVDLPGASRIDVRLGAQGTLAGRVLDAATGEPVAGATVSVATYLLPEPIPRPSVACAGSARCTSGADGAFRIEGLAVGQLNGISVLAPGYLPYPDGIAPQPAADFATRVEDGATSTIVLRVHRGAAIHGRVFDDAGRSVAGARVGAMTTETARGNARAGMVTTDDSGGYRIDGIVPGRVVVWASARGLVLPGWVPWRAWSGQTQREFVFDVAAGGDIAHDVVLAPAAAVEGTVVDADGKPVADAGVYGPDGMGTALTDASGAFRLDGAAPGQGVQLFASHPSGLHGSSSPVDLAAGVTLRGVRIVTGPSASIAGRVRRADGAALTGAWLGYVPREIDASVSGNGPESALTEAKRVLVAEDGTFRIAPASPQPYSLVARADGCAPVLVSVARLRDGESREGIDIALGPEAVVTGRVLDDAGAPLADVAVCVERTETVPQFTCPAAVTDGDGRFEARGLVPGRYLVGARTAEHAPAWTEAHPGSDVVLRLARGAVIEGRVVDESGAPPANAGRTVSIIDAQDFWCQAAVRADGTFTSPVLDPRSRYTVETRAPAEFLLDRRRDVAPGGAPVVLVLRRGQRIAGRVADAEGRALAGVRVQAEAADRQPDGGGLASSMSRADGSFEIVGLRSARFRLVAGGGDGPFVPTAAPELVDAPSSDIVLTTRRGAALSGRVVDADGRAVVRVALSATWPGAELLGWSCPSQVTDGDGRFAFTCLPPEGVRLTTWLAAEKRSVDLGFRTVPAKDVTIALPR